VSEVLVASAGARVGLAAALDRLQERLALGTAAVYSAGYASIGLSLLLVSIVAEGMVSRRLPWRRSALDAYLLAFVGVFVVSGLVSPYRSVALGSTVLAVLAIYVAYGLLYRLLTRNRQLLQRFLWIWYAGGVGAAALAIFFFVVTGGPQAALPAIGPNAVGTTLLIALVMGLGLLMTVRSSLRYVTGAGVSVIVVALALTLSRGAWIGAAGGLIALYGLVWRRTAPSDAGHRPAWPLVLIVVAALAGSLAVLGGEAAVLQRKVLSIVNPWKNRERVFLARSALAIAADRPLLGSGLNTFVLIHPHPSLSADPQAARPKARVRSFAHNIFLNMAAEGGLLGLAAFVALLIRGAAAGWRWHASGQDRIFSATVLAAFAALLVHQQFDGTVLAVHTSAGLWFLLAMMMAHEPRPESRVLRPGSGS
jgi:putative inorganic carbon (HCO3(-)) transporter